MNTYEFLLSAVKVFVNDKILVIIAVTVITILSLIWMPQKAETIVTSAFTGLFGLAVGMGLRRSGDIPSEPPKGGAV